jgi:hypothetical protein
MAKNKKTKQATQNDDICIACKVENFAECAINTWTSLKGRSVIRTEDDWNDITGNLICGIEDFAVDQLSVSFNAYNIDVRDYLGKYLDDAFLEAIREQFGIEFLVESGVHARLEGAELETVNAFLGHDHWLTKSRRKMEAEAAKA